jgi:hypothetical protein
VIGQRHGDGSAQLLLLLKTQTSRIEVHGSSGRPMVKTARRPMDCVTSAAGTSNFKLSYVKSSRTNPCSLMEPHGVSWTLPRHVQLRFGR